MDQLCAIIHRCSFEKGNISLTTLMSRENMRPSLHGSRLFASAEDFLLHTPRLQLAFDDFPALSVNNRKSALEFI